MRLVHPRGCPERKLGLTESSGLHWKNPSAIVLRNTSVARNCPDVSAKGRCHGRTLNEPGGLRHTDRVLAVLLAAFLLYAQTQTEEALASHAQQAGEAVRMGNYAVAESHYRALLKLQPAMAEARTNLGLSCYLQKKYGEAAQEFAAGLKLKPAMSNAWLFLGLSQFHLNRPADAVKSLDLYVSRRPGDFQGLYYLGLSHLALEQYAAAEKALLRAQAADPKSIDALYHLAQVYLGQARRNPGSADRIWPAYQRATESIAALDPGSFRIAQLRAGFYEATGKKAEAITELETLLANDPKVRGLHYTLGCLYLEAVQYEKAADQFRMELQLDSPYPRTYLQLGHAYVAMNKPDQALPLLQQAAGVSPDDLGAAWVDIARAYRALNQFSEATRAYQKAIEFGKRDSSVYYQLAMSARRAGLADVAQRALKESERLKTQQAPAMRAPQ